MKSFMKKKKSMYGQNYYGESLIGIAYGGQSPLPEGGRWSRTGLSGLVVTCVGLVTAVVGR